MDEIKHSQQAFQSVRQQLGKTYLPLINGEYQATQERLIPSTSDQSEVIGSRTDLGEQAEQAMQAARQHSPTGDGHQPQNALKCCESSQLMEKRRAN